MKKKLDILKWLLPLVVLLATACGHDDLVLPDEYQEDQEPPYVELRIAVPYARSLTRGNPIGGEEGNGREPGTLKEDVIHDINVFFFIEQNGLGMDSSDTTKIIRHIFYNLKNDSDPQNTPLVTVDEKNDQSVSSPLSQGYVFLKFECTEGEMNLAKSSGINFVAIANFGPMQDIETLGTLRDINFDTDNTNAWAKPIDAFSQNAKNMDYFLMSTAYNSEGDKYGYNKIEPSGNDFTGTTTLQRLYARLDLWYQDSQIKPAKVNNTESTQLEYTVKNATANTVYLTNVLPVNVMQKPSYLFKKVIELPSTLSAWNAESNNKVWDTNSDVWTYGTFKWGGKENPFATPTSKPNDLPTNYVMERHTTLKNSSGTAGEVDTWYGNTAVSKVKIEIKDKTKGLFSGYYDEYKARYEYDPDSDCNHISIISYANENTHPTNCFHSNYLTGMAFRAVYVPTKIYSGSHETTDAEGKTVIVPTEWSADETLTKIYRYSPSGRDQKESSSFYFTNRTAAEEYSKAHPADNATISTDAEAFTAIEHVVGKDEDGNDIKKWGFVCYYNLWLRHYNDESADPQATYPMEYATVRNNIYRVSVDFSGPGDPEPTMREPDTMKARIFVRKWNYREEDEIIF